MIAVAVGLAPAAWAAGGGPGSLDPAFGSGGIVSASFSSDHDNYSFVAGAAVEADGMIVVSGTNSPNSTSTGIEPSQEAAEIEAFHPDGRPDLSFGNGGVVQGPEGSQGGSVAVMQDGELLFGEVTRSQVVVSELEADGAIDARFGTDGTTTLVDAQPQAGVTGLYVEPDGGILATGETFTRTSCCGNNFVERLTSAGTVDPSFGQNGRIVLGNPGTTNGPPLVQTPNGDIIIASGLDGGSSSRLYQRLSDGAPDRSFGHNGSINMATAIVTALALQPDGKLLVGDQPLRPTEPVLSRFSANGSIDRSFGHSGTLYARSAPRGAGLASAIAVQPNGAILYAGGRTVARINPDGTPDLGFGTSGRSRLPAGTFDPSVMEYAGPFNSITNLAVLPGGAILAVGEISQFNRSTGPETLHALLGRLIGGGPAEPELRHVRLTRLKQKARTSTAGLITLELTAPARVEITIETRKRTLGRLNAGLRPAGKNTIKLPARIHGTRIPAGRLSVKLTATNIAGSSHARA